MIYVLGKVGRWLINKLDYFGGVISLSVYSFFEVFKKHPHNQNLLLYQNLIKQIYFTAFQALKSVFIVSILISFVAVFIMFFQFPNVIPKDTISDVFIMVIFREIIPIVLFVIVISRSVSAIAVEIGNMYVNKEFDILVSMGIDPLFYLMLPRVLGMVFSLLILAVFISFVILVVGPMTILLFYDIYIGEIIDLIFNKVKIQDLLLLFLKVVFVGFFLPSIASYHGFKTPTRNLVPVSATRSIMASLSFSFISSLTLSLLFYIFVF
ncbi:MAG: MlaE family ABC transporter permease [Brevinematia bacterium]